MLSLSHPEEMYHHFLSTDGGSPVCSQRKMNFFQSCAICPEQPQIMVKCPI